ncbi:MAG: phosphoenolpyruvate--protein phosphotransferase [Bacillota bacterium]
MSRVTLAAPMAGWVTSLKNVPDPVFSEEMMGVGVAIDPTEGKLVSPCAAEVLMVAPTRHSLTLRTTEGAELLIHIGLETVALEGRGFKAHVRDGDHVSAGDLLISFDLDAVGLEAKSLVTPILLTNTGEFSFAAGELERLVEAGEPVGSIEGTATLAPQPGTAAAGETAEAVIGFAHGLHARPAARVADCAKRFASEIRISLGDKSASARSPTAIMALNARKGDRLLLEADGADAAAALEALVGLIEPGEEEEHRPQAAAAPARTAREDEIAGVCALPGIAVGTAVHWRRHLAEASAEGRGVEVERAALEQALGVARARLEAFSAELGGPGSGIAKAHIGLLEDEELRAAALRGIDDGKSAACAWQEAASAAAESLRQADNPLLRERIADLDDISAQVTAALVGDSAPAPVELPEDAILIADELLPSELMSLPRERLAGLATAGGGATSHMALIAASFGIPTVVAMGPAVSRVPEGARVLLDAAAGVLVVNPDEAAQARAVAAARQVAAETGECRTRDGQAVRLLANLGALGEVDAALAAGAEGCGLLRTEFLFLDRADAPSAEEQRRTYQAIADALGGRPLTIRTLDIGGDKPVSYIRFPHEQNPALGARGIRTELFKPELLDEQLRAIAQVEGQAIKVMLPMVSSVAELRAVRERIAGLGKELTVGVMVETPAAALIADRLAAEADFLSIGSNDLAQYALAMDRTNPLLASSIDGLHPAVLRLMAMTVDAGRRASKPVSLCGNLASEPLAALVLTGLGIRELSGVPAALPQVRHAIGQVSASDCAALAERALGLESGAQVRALAAELLKAGEGEVR